MLFYLDNMVRESSLIEQLVGKVIQGYNSAAQDATKSRPPLFAYAAMTPKRKRGAERSGDERTPTIYQQMSES